MKLNEENPKSVLLVFETSLFDVFMSTLLFSPEFSIWNSSLLSSGPVGAFWSHDICGKVIETKKLNKKSSQKLDVQKGGIFFKQKANTN